MIDFISLRTIGRVRGLALLVFLAVMGQAEWAIAHGAKIDYKTTQALEIQASYDSGEPMANAQITVYAPGRSEPWLKGKTDDKGRFTFSPDTTQPGNWEVKVRQAGHGDIATIPVGNTATALTSPSSTGSTPAQTAVMAASVLWGFVGTALFFARRKK